MIRNLLAWLVPAVLLPFTAWAEGGAQTYAGRWIGTALNDKYSGEAIVFTRPSSDPLLGDALAISGTITLTPGAQGGSRVVVEISGEHSGNSGFGTVTYTDRTGQVRNTQFRSFTLTLEGVPGLGIAFESSEFGLLSFGLEKSPGIAGVWLFPDGNPVTITRQQDGTYMGTYRGTAASGHAGLAGTLSGVFEAGVWDGLFTITEGDVLASGRFQMTLSGTSPDETLDGTFTGSSNIDPVIRTNPVKLVRGEG